MTFGKKKTPNTESTIAEPPKTEATAVGLKNQVTKKVVLGMRAIPKTTTKNPNPESSIKTDWYLDVNSDFEKGFALNTHLPGQAFGPLR